MMYSAFFACFLILPALNKDTALAQDLKSPATDFSRHIVVQPTMYHARTKREIPTTRHTNRLHHSGVTIKVNIEDEEYVLDLRLNEDLITDNHVISYQKDGQNVKQKPNKEELDLCQYAGSVRGKPNSWAAVSTCHGVKGAIYDGKQMRYIEPAESDEINSAHYVYSHSDLVTSSKCGYEGGVTNNSHYDPLLLKKPLEPDMKNRAARYNREATEVRAPYTSNSYSRYVELVLVADHGLYKNLQNLDNVHRYMKDIANIVNSIYAPLNIFIALVGVDVRSLEDEILSNNSGDVLNHFLQYRRTQLLSKLKIMNDNAHLITCNRFEKSIVGLGGIGTMCSPSSGAISSNFSSVIGLVAATVAHEIGHNFGMGHDKDHCVCPDKNCVMASTIVDVMPMHWSTCSVRTLTQSFDKGLDYCLRNKPKSLFKSPTCGNGFVEEGEGCDCGQLIDKRERSACHACCLPHSCMLRENATCASGECCDISTCRMKKAGTICRSANKECDLPEYCDGNLEFCPRDVYKMDSTPCGKHNETYCAGGSCKSRKDQCRLLWGSSADESDAECYKHNINGNMYGNCGYDHVQATHKQCSPEDVLCGTLQCQHFEPFQFESRGTDFGVHYIIRNGLIQCHTAAVNLSLGNVDPGLVPDGAKCGDNKMCFKQRCESVHFIRAKVNARETSVCPSKHLSLDCNGNGFCNSEGHCHCLPGFAPPDCSQLGAGGSYDSGPASDTSIQSNFMVAMYVIFLGILPLVLLIIFLIYHSRDNVVFCCQSGYRTQHRSFFNKFSSLTLITSFICNFFTDWTYESSNKTTEETPCNFSARNTDSNNILCFNGNLPQNQDIPSQNNITQTSHRNITKKDIIMINDKSDPAKASNNELSKNVCVNSNVTKNLPKPISRPPPLPILQLKPKPLDKPIPQLKPKPLDKPIPQLKPKPLDKPIPQFKPKPLDKPISQLKLKPLDKPIPQLKPKPLDKPIPQLKPKPLDKPIPQLKPKPLDKSIPQLKPKPLDKPIPQLKLKPPVKPNISIPIENIPNSVTMNHGLPSTAPNRTMMIARDLERVFAARK